MTTQTQQKEGGALWNELRSLISMIDELRDMGLQQYIKLPRIAVLGRLSSKGGRCCHQKAIGDETQSLI
jgi:vacuolar protein sorting-associated protein 1